MSKVKVEIKGLDQPNDKRLTVADLNIGDYFVVDTTPEEVFLISSKSYELRGRFYDIRAINVKTGYQIFWRTGENCPSAVPVTKFNGVVVSVRNPVKYKKNDVGSDDN